MVTCSTVYTPGQYRVHTELITTDSQTTTYWAVQGLLSTYSSHPGPYIYTLSRWSDADRLCSDKQRLKHWPGVLCAIWSSLGNRERVTTTLTYIITCGLVTWEGRCVCVCVWISRTVEVLRITLVVLWTQKEACTINILVFEAMHGPREPRVKNT